MREHVYNHKMSFNPAKCSVLKISNKKTPPTREYAFCGQILQHTTSQPYLGVTLDNKLSWGNHVDNTVAKASRTLGFLRRNLWFCPKEVKTLAYTTLVRPQLEYATCAWDPYKITQINKLERVQRKAARFCLGNYERRSSVNQMLKELQWEPLEIRRVKSRLSMLYKLQNGLVAIQSDKYLSHPQTKRTRIKNDKQIEIPFARTDIYKNSYFVRTSSDWNNLEI